MGIEDVSIPEGAYAAATWEERARAERGAGEAADAVGPGEPPPESEALFAALLRHSFDAIVLNGRVSRRILEVSDSFCALSGYAREEVIGRTSLELGLVQDAEHAEVSRRVDAGLEGLYERRLRRKDGELRAVEFSNQLLPGNELVLTIIRDISARKEAEEELVAARADAERANHAKNVFLSRMSHELRTPLNAILGFSQLLELQPLPAEQRESVELIAMSGRVLLELINEVLDIAQIETGELRVSLEPLSVVEPVNEALEMMRPLADERRIRLDAIWHPGARGRHVKADRRRLGQILLNLVSNAVKYNVAGGSVTVRCLAPDDRRIRFAVTDTGPGIAPDKVELLFIPFERLGAERRDIEGTGLGLTVSKSLAEAMGGRLTVDATVGVGSTFVLELPAASMPTSDGAPTRDERAWPTDATPTGRVLYIEDSAPNVMLVRAILKLRPNVELLAAMTANAGFELARTSSPDLVLLDMQLPDESGDKVLQWLLRDPRTAGVPVVITSADATPGQVERMVAAGATDYLTKPLDVRSLLGLVDRLLAPSGADQPS